MVVRVARQVASAERIHRVVVATDDQRIADACTAHEIESVLTSERCASGTDRVAEAFRALGEAFDRVINVQGDEPLIDPRDVDVLAALAADHPEAVTTLARPIRDRARFESPNVVKVVVAGDGRALYFSRAPIPHGSPDLGLQHVGIYGFSPEVLLRFTSSATSSLERGERLEQLRALEIGIPIYVARTVSERATIGVDTPEDLAAVLQEIGTFDGKRNAHVSQ
jgi:3-deoxy-manno-octulosonate cytidylyltransferase (CMP-KDO synthetase)